MRRSLAATAAGAAAALLVITPAWADESISGGSWAGSALDAGPGSVPVNSYQLSGTFRRASISRQIEVVLSSAPSRSGACTVTPVAAPVGGTPLAFSLTLSIPCNGTYELIATATTKDNNAFLPADSAQLTRMVDIVAPAPTVTGLEVDARRRLVDLSWDDMVPVATDVSGYLVERRIGSGAFERIARVPVGTEDYSDTSLPTGSGTATYRVRSTRPSPVGEQVSGAAETPSVEFTAAPSGETGGTTGGTTGGETGGTTDGENGGTTGGETDGSTGSDSTGGSVGGGFTGGTTSGKGSTGSGIAAPRLFAGTFLPPLLRPASEIVTTDPGYSGELPYDPRRPNDEQAGPEESFSSIASEDGGPRRGMVVPVATALVLATWAFHLRMLARAARPIP